MSRIFASAFLTARLVSSPAQPRWATDRQRRRVVRAIDALARPVGRPEQMLGPPIVRVPVARAALPYLRAASSVLTDPDVALPADVVQATWRFLTDGLRSPLFDDSPDVARQHAYGLCRRLVADSTSFAAMRSH